MKHLYVALFAAMALAACQNDDSDFETLKAQSKEAPKEITFSSSPLAEVLDAVPLPDDETYNDYIESFSPKHTVTIAFSDDGGAVVESDESVAIGINGAHVMADISTKSVKFVLKGTCSNGSLTVYGQNRFQITLDNLNLTNPAGAAINSQCKKTMYVDCPAGTENLLVSKPSGKAELAKGCLFSEGQIAFSGSGRLIVASTFRNAIASDDYIFFRPQCQIDVDCISGNGIKANDGVKINGGTINITVNYDGGKGINCENHVAINGGRTTIMCLGTTRFDKVAVSEEFPQGIDTVSCAGVKCDESLIVTSGELLIKCSGDDTKGIKTRLDYKQTGGAVSIVTLGKKVFAAPKGIKADGNILVTDGYLYSYSTSSAPLDADGTVNAYSFRKQKSYVIEIGK